MPSHWTYDAFEPAADLQQGDILWPTQELMALFRDVHPHFCSEKYLAFIVITQSCDLARRAGSAATKYINLAVVRSLSQVLPSLLDNTCKPIKPGVYLLKTKNDAVALLQRLFNQNEQKLGLFYLFPDGDIGIGEDAVAFLRVSVAFRAEHYDLMTRARRGRLAPEFANKLGWLVGNLYARAATRDWPEADLKTLVRKCLSTGHGSGIEWVPDKLQQLLKQAGRSPGDLSREDLLVLAHQRVPSPGETGIDQVISVVQDVMGPLEAGVASKLRGRLVNDAVLRSTFRA